MENNIQDYFYKPSQIVIYCNNTQTTLIEEDDKFKQVLKSLQTISNSAHEMPALGVADHSLTLQELTHGIWIELIFSTTQTHNELPFDSLLIQVDSTFSGFNIIRKYNNKFDGRCFYLNLQTTMAELENSIKNLSKNCKN